MNPQEALEPQRPKKSPLPVPRTWLDRNVASLGLFAASNRRTGKKRTVRLPSKHDANGNLLQRRVTISPNADLKELITQDLDFFIAFMEIAQEQRIQAGGVLKNPISFTPYRLFKQLGYKSMGKRNYVRLERWLQRVTGTLLISQNALHRADEDLFLNADFVLFQGVITRGKTLDGGRVADKCYVWLHDWQVANINSNHSFPVPKNYKALNHRIAKNQAFLLPGWFYASNDQGFFEKDYLDFCKTLGIQPQHYRSKMREKLHPALEELVSWGIFRWC